MLAHSHARSVCCDRGRSNSSSCIVKKFGGLTARETVPTSLHGWNFTMYRRDWRTFPSRAQVQLFTGSILRDADCDRWHWTVFQPVSQLQRWRAFQVLHASEIWGGWRTVLFDFTFVHLFPAAAVASGNCKFSEYSVLRIQPWLKSILRDPTIKSLAV